MLILPEHISDQMWWKMCDAHMSLPIPLEEANLLKPFVYSRAWGLSYVPSGMHQLAMSLLLAFQHQLTSCSAVAELLGLNFSEETADYWLEHTPGAAFLSSVSTKVQVGDAKNLTALERRLFGSVQSIFA